MRRMGRENRRRREEVSIVHGLNVKFREPGEAERV